MCISCMQLAKLEQKEMMRKESHRKQSVASHGGIPATAAAGKLRAPSDKKKRISMTR